MLFQGTSFELLIQLLLSLLSAEKLNDGNGLQSFIGSTLLFSLKVKQNSSQLVSLAKFTHTLRTNLGYFGY